MKKKSANGFKVMIDEYACYYASVGHGHLCDYREHAKETCALCSASLDSCKWDVQRKLISNFLTHGSLPRS